MHRNKSVSEDISNNSKQNQKDTSLSLHTENQFNKFITSWIQSCLQYIKEMQNSLLFDTPQRSAIRSSYQNFIHAWRATDSTSTMEWSCKVQNLMSKMVADTHFQRACISTPCSCTTGCIWTCCKILIIPWKIYAY